MLIRLDGLRFHFWESGNCNRIKSGFGDTRLSISNFIWGPVVLFLTVHNTAVHSKWYILLLCILLQKKKKIPKLPTSYLFYIRWSVLCNNLEGWVGLGWGVGGRFKREGTYIYLWLIYVVAWQKPTQHCKAIILQLKINLKKTENKVCLTRWW